MLWDIQPHGILVECILVRVETAEGGIAFRSRAVSIRIHGGIVLVTKRKAGTGLTMAICFGTLPANGFLLVTLELPLTASQAVRNQFWSRGLGSLRAYHPVRDLMPLSFWLSSLVEIQYQGHSVCLRQELDDINPTWNPTAGSGRR